MSQKNPPDPTEADLQMQAQLGAILQNMAIFTGFLADLSSGHCMVLVQPSSEGYPTYRVVPNTTRSADGWSEDDAGAHIR